ncbi:MAG TPA: acyltransferase family protein [Acidimicrobiales bacterium]|nr:acyltransferase family protein [Acidimicrobiales bacterium]
MKTDETTSGRAGGTAVPDTAAPDTAAPDTAPVVDTVPPDTAPVVVAEAAPDVAPGVAPDVDDVPPAPDLSPPPKPAWQSRPVGYLPALDGVRALAVGLVVAYHLGYSGVPGGYIGVEVFFVLSGWLVCALLVNEHHRTGAVGLRAFWMRRARRLLPAVATVIVATLGATALAQPERLAALRGHGVAALAYHLNWRLVVDQQSYFEAAGGPSALEHLWSLSIEEQFYLVFPLVAGFVLVWTSRRRAIALLLGAALVSTLLRLALVSPGSDPSRAYFGSDTRAAGLLLGAAFALFWTPNRLRPHDDRLFTAGLDAVAAAGVAALLWYAVAVSEGDATAFRLGFTLVQVGTLALVAVAVYPAPTRTASLLSARPLAWLGRRSYGIYLVHWPVIVLRSRAPGEQPGSTATVLTEVALTLGLAALMYRWVEQPVRHRGLGGAVRHARARFDDARARRPAAAVGLVAAGLVVAGTGLSLARDVVAADAPVASQPASVSIGPRAAPAAGPAPTAAPVETTLAPAAPPPPALLPVATAVGDSVLVGAADALAARLGPTFVVDASIGRQLVDATAVVTDMAARGQLGGVVIISLGHNGPFTGEQIDQLFGAIGPDRTVLLVNVLVPRRWEGEVNDALIAAVERHPNAVLVDWRSVVTTEPGLTRDDGYHLTAAGAERYADTVVAAMPPTG